MAACSKAYSIAVAPAPVNNAQYWKMEEASGDRVDSIQGKPLVPDTSGGGSVTQVAGKINQGAQMLSVNTQSCGLVEGVTGIPNGADGFTLFGWFQNSVSGGNVQWEFGPYPAAGLWIVFVLNSTALGPVLYYNGSTTPIVLPGAGWQFFILEWVEATSQLRLEFNRSGTVYTLGAASPGVGMVMSLFSTTTCGAASSSMLGLDEIGLWGQLLTNAQKDFVYNGGAGRTWPFTLP